MAGQDRRLLAIRLPENKGKAAAMLTGVQALDTDLAIFLDADLVGLTPHHLEQLVSLQKSGSHEMAVAVFEIGMEFSNVPQRLIPQLSGQRCLWRHEAEQALLPLATDRYAVEIGLNLHAKHHHWHIRKIVWPGVTHHMVWLKQKPAAVLHNRLQMYSQIMKVIARNRYRYRRELQPVRLPRKFRFISRR
jgi:glycosyltransferase involved in cell wall biosynthesis